MRSIAEASLGGLLIAAKDPNGNWRSARQRTLAIQIDVTRNHGNDLNHGSPCVVGSC